MIIAVDKLELQYSSPLPMVMVRMSACLQEASMIVSCGSGEMTKRAEFFKRPIPLVDNPTLDYDLFARLRWGSVV